MATALSRTKEEAGYLVTHHFPMDLATVADGDVVVTYPMRYDGEIVALDIVVTTAVTTAAKASTFTLKIGSTAVPGISIATTSATATPKGKVFSDTPTGNTGKTFRSGQTISITAASTTTYIEGAVCFVLTCRACT